MVPNAVLLALAALLLTSGPAAAGVGGFVGQVFDDVEATLESSDRVLSDAQAYAAWWCANLEAASGSPVPCPLA